MLYLYGDESNTPGADKNLGSRIFVLLEEKNASLSKSSAEAEDRLNEDLDSVSIPLDMKNI